MRSYGQYCAMAKALDLVGDRWTLLIVRELLLRGQCRYTDLRQGLPGIATNLLAERLRELEQAGVIRREAAPPPVATTVFRLTRRGEELAPVFVEHVGDDYLMIATDYPHSDAIDKFPDKTVGDISSNEKISRESRTKILWDNPTRAYSLGA